MQAAVAVQHPAQLRQRVFYRVENHTTMYKWHLALRSPGRQRVGFHPYGQRPARRGGTLGCRCSDDVVGGQRRAAVNTRQLRRPRRRRCGRSGSGRIQRTCFNKSWSWAGAPLGGGD